MLQAAVAEVEDYVRVDVMIDSADAVAETAVNDVIHLIAELVENATAFSPPNTRVTITGGIVGRGFAVDIEDRGLGLEPDAMAAINERLASPPEFDLADSDQLGLFVAGRLAARHGIRAGPRPSWCSHGRSSCPGTRSAPGSGPAVPANCRRWPLTAWRTGPTRPGTENGVRRSE